MKDIQVSIIIVSFNTKELLKGCLHSIEASQCPTDAWEIIVVDNASTDGSAQYLKKKNHVVSVFNDTNVGFSRANNQGISKAHGRYVLFLNSDTELLPNSLQVLLAYMDTYRRVGVVTCRVELANGAIDPACHRGFPTPWAAFTYFFGLERLFPRSIYFSSYHLGYKDMQTIHEIDAPTGAFFLTRSEILHTLHGFDEEYFMYGEDLDLAYRIKKAGWPIVYYPKVSILHRKKQSGRSGKNGEIKKRTDIYFYDTMKIFYKKYFMKAYPFFVTRFIFMILSFRIWIIKTIGW
ncbi:glycosyltransferase family 2 protein [Candidatus Gottesmanbacteria bacterium]|nr:glycosyltransferase family 2 protein [Candidatus Gottesmanbacteria bacterium]